MITCRFTASAHNDLNSICDYLLPRAPDAAERLLDRIEGTIELLVSNPCLGQRRAELGLDVRGFFVDGYWIIYREIGPELQVLRIYHHARGPMRA